MIDERRATAIHEAGHAVVAIEERLAIKSVSILEDGHSLGRTVSTFGLAPVRSRHGHGF